MTSSSMWAVCLPSFSEDVALKWFQRCHIASIFPWCIVQMTAAIMIRCKFWWSILNNATYTIKKTNTPFSTHKKTCDLWPINLFSCEIGSLNILPVSDQTKQEGTSTKSSHDSEWMNYRSENALRLDAAVMQLPCKITSPPCHQLPRTLYLLLSRALQRFRCTVRTSCCTGMFISRLRLSLHPA